MYEASFGDVHWRPEAWLFCPVILAEYMSECRSCPLLLEKLAIFSWNVRSLLFVIHTKGRAGRNESQI
jgi:hypothetical protein